MLSLCVLSYTRVNTDPHRCDSAVQHNVHEHPCNRALVAQPRIASVDLQRERSDRPSNHNLAPACRSHVMTITSWLSYVPHSTQPASIHAVYISSERQHARRYVFSIFSISVAADLIRGGVVKSGSFLGSFKLGEGPTYGFLALLLARATE
jgi:hypothetical protein